MHPELDSKLQSPLLHTHRHQQPIQRQRGEVPTCCHPVAGDKSKSNLLNLVLDSALKSATHGLSTIKVDLKYRKAKW